MRQAGQHEPLEQRRSTVEADAFRVAFDHAPVGVAIGLAEGRIVYANEAMSRLLGRPRDELDGSTFEEATHPDERSALRARMRALAEGPHDAYAADTRFLHPDGTTAWARVHVAAHRGSDGRVELVVAHAQDTTDHKHTELALRASEDRFRAASEASLDALMILRAVRSATGSIVDFEVTEVNANAERMYGRTRGQLLGGRLLAGYPQAGPLGIFERYVGVVETREPVETEHSVDGGRQPEHWVREQVVPLGDGIAVTVSDISERKAAELALAENEVRFRTLLRHSTDVATVIGPDGTIRYASPAVEAVLGYQPEAFRGTNPFDLLHPDDRRGWITAWTELVHSPGARCTLEARALHADGAYRWCEATFRNPGQDANVDGYLVHFHDITDRRRAEEDLSHRALHDDLTGLANRALLLDRLAHALSRAERDPDVRVAVLFLDLDHFKVVNDTLGHSVGDALLVEAAARLRGAVRPSDTIARLGGDEFAISCEDVRSTSEAVAMSERILDAFRDEFHPHGHPVRLSTSIGIALSGPVPQPAQTLVSDADAAMYVAKNHGRDRIEVYDDRVRTRVLERLDTETGLRRALDCDELRLLWQPIFAIGSQRMVGVEALLRWDHPDRGLVTPDRFLGVAEQAGLDDAIGDWVLHDACRQARAWRDLGAPEPGTVWVNLSVQQATRSTFAPRVRAALDEHALPPSTIGFDLTEAALMEADRAPGARNALVGLVELGCRLAIDDFGTGYSSLRSVQRYAVDVLKIDRSIVHGAGAEGTTIIEAAVSLGRLLSVGVTAEGVETAEQLALVAEAGCQSAAGFLLGVPTSAEELTRAIRRNGARAS